MLALKSQAVSISYQTDGKALRRETPETIVAAMYDLGQLSDAETALLSVFAVLPAENIAYATLEILLPGIGYLEAMLLGLAQKGWLEHGEAAAALKVSPVVQEITRQKNRERLLQDSQDLINTLNEKLDYEPGLGHFLNASYEEAALFAHYAKGVVHRISETANDLAILCERLGSYHTTTGNLILALGFFDERSRLGKELYEAYPDNVSFKNGLAISYTTLGGYYEKTENTTKVKENYLLSKELLTQLVKSFPKYVEFKNNLAWIVSKLSEL